MRISYWIGLFLAGALAAGAQTVPSSFNYQLSVRVSPQHHDSIIVPG